MVLVSATLTALVLGTAIQAAPDTLGHLAQADASDTLRDLVQTAQLNVTAWRPGYVLQAGEAIVLGRTAAHIVRRHDLDTLIEPALRKRFDEVHAAAEPLVLGPFIDDVGAIDNATSRRTGKRCTKVTNLIIDKTETFIDWDVQMSVVFHSVSDRVNTVSVSDGWTVWNQVTAGVSSTLTLIEDVLQAALHIDYTYAWSTTGSATVTSNVDTGYSGVMITKPLTTRRTGRLIKGCVGEMELISSWSGSSHNDAVAPNTGGLLKWVQGIVTLCEKKIDANTPLSRCTGYGNFI